MNEDTAWSLFLNSQSAANFFSADGSDEDQLYYCLTEVACALRKTDSGVLRMIEAIGEFTPLQQACCLDALVDHSSYALAAFAEAHLNSANEKLCATSLTYYNSFWAATLANVLKNALRSDLELVRTHAATCILKTMAGSINLIEDNLLAISSDPSNNVRSCVEDEASVLAMQRKPLTRKWLAQSFCIEDGTTSN